MAFLGYIIFFVLMALIDVELLKVILLALGVLLLIAILQMLGCSEGGGYDASALAIFMDAVT